MRVNVYVEELTDRVEVIEKKIDERTLYGLRFYLYLPVSNGRELTRGPFVHHEGDDDSAAITFWCDTDVDKGELLALGKAIMQALMGI